MVVDASIPLSIKPPNFMTPFEAQSQMLTLQQQQQNAQMRNMELAQNMQTLRDQQQLSTLAANQSNMDVNTGTFTPEAIASIQNPMLRQKVNADRIAMLQKTAEINLKNNKDFYEVEKHKKDAVAEVYQTAYSAYESTLKKTGGNEQKATEEFNRLQAGGLQELRDTGRGGFSSDQKFKQLTPREAEYKLITHKERAEEEARAVTAARMEETTFIKESNYLRKLEAQIAALPPGDPQAEKLQKSLKEVQMHVAKLDNSAKTTVHIGDKTPSGYRQTKDGNLEFIPGGPADPKTRSALAMGATSGKQTMDADSIDYAANQLDINGVLPPGVSRNDANVGAIYKRAAEISKAKGNTAAETIFNSKSIKADSTSLAGLTKQTDSIRAFEGTALKNLDMLVSQSAKVPRTAFPLLNKAILEGKLATGDPEVAKLNAIVKPFVDEYAKILSGSTGAAGATDTARKEAAGIIAGYMSPDQIKQLAPFIRQELKNRTDSLDEQQAAIRERMKSGHKAVKEPSDKATAPPKGAQAYPTATNPQTGERMQFKDGKWQPMK